MSPLEDIICRWTVLRQRHHGKTTQDCPTLKQVRPPGQSVAPLSGLLSMAAAEEELLDETFTNAAVSLNLARGGNKVDHDSGRQMEL